MSSAENLAFVVAPDSRHPFTARLFHFPKSMPHWQTSYNTPEHSGKLGSRGGIILLPGVTAGQCGPPCHALPRGGGYWV